MKKAILILGALLMVVSGVAAVSAYEAHAINIFAHVENALTVDLVDDDDGKLDYGTVFPQEWYCDIITVNLSESAESILGTGTGNLTSVDYKMKGEYKSDGAGDWYMWIGEYVWLKAGATVTCPTEGGGAGSLSGWSQVGAQPETNWKPGMGMGKPDPFTTGTSGIGGEQTLDANTLGQEVGVLFLAPCFHDFYNAETDEGKPLWWLELADWPLLIGDHTGQDMGMELKFQVTGINRVTQ